MKTMTCKQLGGACSLQFHAISFEEMAEQSKQHSMDMLKKGDEAHLKAMNDMQTLMQSPAEMKKWMDDKRKMFEALPDD